MRIHLCGSAQLSPPYVTNASYVASINQLQISVSGSSSDAAEVTGQSIAAGEKVQIGTVITLSFVDNTNAETGATVESE